MVEKNCVITIVPSKLRNDRFFRRFVSDSFVNYEGHINLCTS